MTLNTSLGRLHPTLIKSLLSRMSSRTVGRLAKSRPVTSVSFKTWNKRWRVVRLFLNLQITRRLDNSRAAACSGLAVRRWQKNSEHPGNQTMTQADNNNLFCFKPKTRPAMNWKKQFIEIHIKYVSSKFMSAKLAGIMFAVEFHIIQISVSIISG